MNVPSWNTDWGGRKAGYEAQMGWGAAMNRWCVVDGPHLLQRKPYQGREILGQSVNAGQDHVSNVEKTASLPWRYYYIKGDTGSKMEKCAIC